MCLPSEISGRAVQSIATILGCLLCLNFGLMFGLTPSHVELYQSHLKTPLKLVIDSEAANWITSYLFLGIAIGALIIGLTTSKIGSKSVLYLGSLLQVVSWFTIHFSFDILHIYSSRIFAGLGAGAVFVALPIFINEITADSILAARHTASIEFWRSLGILMGFAFGQYFNYELVAIIGIGLSLFTTLTLPFVQDSPYYYVKKRNMVNMEKSLRWYRGIRHINDHQRPDFVREVAEFKRKMNDSKPIISNEVPFGYKIKLGIYCMVLISGAQLAGVYIILNYVLQLFKDINVAFIFASIQLFGAFLATCIGYKIRRKLLLILIGIISGCVLISLAWADKWPTVGDANTTLTITIGLLSLYILCCSFGLQPLSVIVTHELLPSKLRPAYLSIINSISWLLLFGLLQSYYYLSDSFGLESYYTLFGGACFLIALLSAFLLPDTESKSSEEVQHEMGLVGTESIPKVSTIYSGQIHERSHL